MSKLGVRGLRLMVIVSGMVLAPAMWAAHVNPRTLNGGKPKSTQKVSESQHTKRRMRHLASSRTTTGHTTTGHVAARASLTRTSVGATSSVSPRRHTYHERFFVSSYAEGLTGGDITDGEDRWYARPRSMPWEI